jgi:hypothetical protein
MTEKSPPFGWVTSAADGREHAVPDPPAGGSPAQVAFCGHRVLPRRCSLLVPPGSRCEPCARACRTGPPRSRTGVLTWAVDLIRDAARHTR